MNITKFRLIGAITVIGNNGLKDFIKIDTTCHCTSDYTIAKILKSYIANSKYDTIDSATVSVYKVYDDLYSVYSETRCYSPSMLEICADMCYHYV